ncbi:ggdef family domain protein, partial [Vibrio parahaemolyticus EKP-028]
HISDANHFAAK